MVSRRNFLSICTMMLVILFLFLFSNVIKEQENDYNVNEYANTQPASGNQKWVMENSKETLVEKDYILFIGKRDSGMGEMLHSFGTYGKRQLYVEESLEELEELPLPKMIVLDSKSIEVAAYLDYLDTMTHKKVTVVFGNLPDTQILEKNQSLMDVLGIVNIVAEEKEVEGIRLFSGFLVGGEAIYKAETLEEEEKRQDLDLNLPWFQTGSAVTTYMVGLLDEGEYERENFPPIIWKNTYQGASVFAVNGDYMSDLTGLGLVSAMDSIASSYGVYPVVNAHSAVMTNYPGFAEENAETIQSIYSRGIDALCQDIMWPSLTALAEASDMKLTFALIPQYNYGDEIEPYGSKMEFYLKQMKEIKAEAGISLDYTGDVTLEEKLERDKAFFEGLETSYPYQAYCMLDRNAEDLTDSQLALMEKVVTISAKGEDNAPLISYYNDAITLQLTTGDAAEYTYSDDLCFRSLETALGYSNVIVDLSRVLWPETKEEQWELYFDEISSNLSTYWKPHKAYDSTTLSEADGRIRSFLNLDYTIEETETGLGISVSDFGEEAWFIFRSHGEDIHQMKGGTFQKMEENMFLLHITEEYVELELETSEEEPEFIF